MKPDRGDASRVAQPAPGVGADVAQSSQSTITGVAQPSPAVSRAQPAKESYRRDLPHLQRPGETFAITFATRNRWKLPEAVRGAVLDRCVYAHGTRFELHAAVVMPNHVHLLLTPNNDSDGATFGLSQILNSIKGASSHAVNKALGRSGAVWQSESFDHGLRSEDSLRGTAEYICANPLRAGLVASEDDYRWLWREWTEGASLEANGRS